MKRFLSLFLAFVLLFSVVPTMDLSNVEAASNKTVELKVETVKRDGKSYIEIPIGKLELAKPRGTITTMAIDPNTPTQNGAGQKINATTAICWQMDTWEFPAEGFKAELKIGNGLDPRENVTIAEVQITDKTDNPDYVTQHDFQFITTDNYQVGDEKKDLKLVFDDSFRANARIAANTATDPITHGKIYYIMVTQISIPAYTAEWYDHEQTTRPNIKGTIYASTLEDCVVDVFKDNLKYGSISTEDARYVDENDINGDHIGKVAYEKFGTISEPTLTLDPGKGQQATGEFTSYVGVKDDDNFIQEEKTLGNKEGKIPAFDYEEFNPKTRKVETKNYPAYFYFLVGDNNHMWRFQMREVLNVKLNSGAGKVNDSEKQLLHVGGNDTQEIGHSEHIYNDDVELTDYIRKLYPKKAGETDEQLKKRVSEATQSQRVISFDYDETVTPTKTKVDGKEVDTVFAGWAKTPQTIDASGKLSDIQDKLVNKDGTLTDAGKAFKFTEKETILYAVFEPKKLGSVKVKYVTIKDGTAADATLDDTNTIEITDGKIQGQNYITEDKGQVGTNAVNPFEVGKEPKFTGYTFDKVALQGAQYAESNPATIYVVYKKEFIADKMKNKLEAVDIKVWKGDQITWKDGVNLKAADATLQAYLDDPSTSYADASTPVRNSNTARKDPFVGTIKITFSDNSTIEVPNQKLYVSEQKVEVKDPSDPDYIDPDHLPDDKIKVEIKLGEGVKENKQGGKEGNAANPVLVKTFYVKPNTGLAETDFPTTTGNNAEIVKQDNYKDPITWDPSELTKTFAKDETGLFVASAKSAQCTAPAVLQAEFEKAIDPMFENIKKKDGVYLGKYDKANKKVTVAIIDKTQVAKELTGTGLATGLEKLYKNNNLIKIKVGTQAERDLRDLAKRQPSSGMTLQQLFATVFGADVINEVQQTGEKTGKLADFIGKSVDLKLTVQEPDCEANAVELTYAIEGKEAISSILKGKLSPQDIKVWKGDEIDWEKGVKKDETELTDEQKEQIKDEFSTYEKGVKKVTGKAKFEDASTPARNSDTAKAEPFVGNIKVTFSDGSELLVEKQNLYVSEIMTGGNNENAPDDAITVTFQLGKGVKAKKGTEDIKGAETPVVYETYKVKPNLNLDDYKLATNKNIFDNINAESIDENKYKDVVWTPTNHVVTKTNNVFTANATEAFIMKHEFKLIDKDDNNKEIPVTDTLKKLLPKDKKVVKDETYTPDKLKDILSVNEGGKYYDYKFQGWKPASAKNEDKTFVGTWTREQAASKTPHINTPNEGDKTIGGKGVPGAEIEVEIPGVKDPIKTKVDKDGNWEVKVPGNKELKKDEKIVVTQTEDGKKPAKDDAIVGKKGGIEVEYPTSEIYVGDYKTVTPEIYGTSTTETDEAPFVVNRRKLEDMGVTVKAHSDGRLTIEIGENYRGPKRFTIDLDVYVDGQEIATYADVIVLEAKTRRPEAAVKTDDREILEHKAYIFGYPDGSVRPQGNITRAEAAAMIARLLNIEAFGSNTKPMFPDTPSAWYNRAINAVVQRGIMKGYPDGSFKPNDPITRAEFTTMIAAIDNKAYGVAPFADVKGHWAELAIGREYQAGRINGYPDGTFRPQRHITRAEAATILNKIFDRCYDAMSLIGTERKENVRIFTDLYQSFWGYNDMVEATNNHSFKRRVEGRVEEDWVMVK